MYDRKEGKKEALLSLEDRAERLDRFYSLIRSSGEKIHFLLKVSNKGFPGGFALSSQWLHNGVEMMMPYKCPVFSQSNLQLFRAEQTSEEWKAYVEYVDDMVIDGFFNSIECSLKFFLENTGRSVMTSNT